MIQKRMPAVLPDLARLGLRVVGVVAVFAVSACMLACREAPGDPEPIVRVMQATQLLDDELEITCGPFVDGFPDSKGKFSSGRCSGEICGDVCGCVCLKCSDDSGFCYGLCREVEGCDPLSEPPGGWQLKLDEQVLVALDR